MRGLNFFLSPQHFRRNLFDTSAATVADSQDLTEEEKIIKVIALKSGTLQALRFILEVLLDSVQVDEKVRRCC